VPSVVDASAGALFLQDVGLLDDSGGYENRAGAGQLFLEDVAGGPWNFSNQRVWARQLDPEDPVGPKISNAGGDLWILGLKTERPTTVLRTTDGGSSEVFGGFVYPVESVAAGTPAFVSIDSRVSLNYLAQMSPNAIQVSETRDGVTRTQLGITGPGDIGGDTLMPLYVG
jgi:hypothetical protein